MLKNTPITIRPAHVSDIKNLCNFFSEAYGPQTVFQNKEFLMHYFAAFNKSRPSFGMCVIGVNSVGGIVSHYGGLYYKLKMGQVTWPIIWGVNAYTLPEWRGKGLNTKIVSYILDNNEINGVIGFTRETSLFYQKNGYNMFNFDRFSRFVSVLDYTKTAEIVALIGQSRDRFNKFTQSQGLFLADDQQSEIIRLTKENIRNYEFNIEAELAGIVTTHRTVDFLIWRFLENPGIDYHVYAVLERGAVVAFIALREETLAPTKYKVNRIIDLYGKKDAIRPLLGKAVRESISKKHIYIDFSMFGTIYQNELISSKFFKLTGEDSCLLPQVTAPIEKRENYEYLGIQSQSKAKAISTLSIKNVYFTRMDSDRDRLANVSQM